MAIVFSDETSINLAELKGRQLSDIFVKVYFNGNFTDSDYVALTELYNKDRTYYFLPSGSYSNKDLQNYIADKNNEFFITVNGENKHIFLKSDDKLLIKNTQISNDLSTIEARKTFGLQQQIGVVESKANYNSKTKVYVKLKGDKNFTLVDAKDVYVFTNGTSVALSELTDKDILGAISKNQQLDNVVMYYGNREIETLDKSKFEQAAVINQESYETRTVNGKDLLMHKGVDDKDFSQVADSVVKSNYVDYKGNDGKDLRIVQSQRFQVQADRKGGYIYVTDKQGQQHFVSIEDLFAGSLNSPTQIDEYTFLTSPEMDANNNYLNFVGQNLLLKTGDTYIELAPLTADQISKVYGNTTYTPTVVNSPDVIAKPGVYRKTTDGKYFEESQIQPLCYDYADGNKDFTDYLFTIETSDGKRTVIVPRDEFKDNKNRVQVKINTSKGNQICYANLSAPMRPRQLLRTNKPISSCAVVRTTTTSFQPYDFATVLKVENSDEIVENETTKKLQDKFLQDYRAGVYRVDSVYNQDGKLVEFSQSSNRYVMTDYIELVDYNGNSTDYENFKNQTLPLTSKGLFQGKATFDRKRANKAYASGAKYFALTSLQLMLSPMGLLTMIALPALPLVSVAAIASIPIARIVNRIREANSKAKISKAFKNDPQFKNSVKNELALYEKLQQVLNTTSYEYEVGENAVKKQFGKNAKHYLNSNQIDSFKESMLLLQEEIEANYSRKNSTTVLHIVDGKAEINAQNAYLAKRYEQMMIGLNGEIKSLQRRVKRTKGRDKVFLQQQLEEKLSSRDAMKTNYTLTPDELPENKQSKEEALAYLQLAKAMVVINYTDAEVDDKVKAFADKLTVDFRHRSIKYKGKEYSSVAELVKKVPALKDNIESLNTLAAKMDKTEHQDINGKAITMPVKAAAEKTEDLNAEAEKDLTSQATKQEELNAEQTAANTQEQVVEPAPIDETEISLLEKTGERLNKQIAEQDNGLLDNQLQFINQAFEKESLTEEDVSKISQNVDDLTNYVNSLQQQVISVQASTNAIAGSEEEVKAGIKASAENLAGFNSNLEKCGQNIEKLQELLNQKMDADQAAQITEKINALQNIVTGYQGQVNQTISNAVTHIETISKNQNVDIAVYVPEIEQLKQSLVETTEKQAEVSIDADASIDSRVVEQKIEENEQEKSKAETEAEKAKEDQQNLENKIAKLEDKITSIEKQIATKQQQIDSHDGNIYIRIEEANKLKEDLTKANEKHAEYKHKAKDLNNQVKKLNTKIDKLETDNATLTDQAEKLKEANKNIADINTKLEETNKAQSTKIGELNKLVTDLNTAIASAEKQAEQLKQDNSKDATANKAEVEALKKKVEEVEAKRDKLQATYDSSREELAKQKQIYSQQIEELSSEIAKKDESISKLQQQNQQYKMLARKLAGEKQSVVQAAEETIAAIDQLLNSKQVDQKQIEKIKNQIASGKLYGLKTEVDAMASSSQATLLKIKNSYNLADKRIESLKEMQVMFADEEDEQLQMAVDVAGKKILALQEKQKQLKQVEANIQSVSASFADLKEYVTVAKVKQDIEKNVLSAKFATGLQPTEVDVKFLAAVIGNFKNAIKMQKALISEIAGRTMDFETESMKQELVELIEKLQTFIKANYNVFNLCEDEKVKEKYYEKVSGYSKYDHSVVFSMPNTGKNTGGEDPTIDDGLKN